MIEGIVAILAGLLLITPIIGRGSAGAKVVGKLTPFEAVIGVVALIVGVLNVMSVTGLVLIVAGLLLAASALAKIPAIGSHLARAGKALKPFRVVIGVVVLVIGVLVLLGIVGGGPPPGLRTG
ncbi:hypothetical protein ACN2MM_00635 [Alkalilimnicola ehrlichii MLHE-1]|uniref:hypothetical protein n=1 Tax=Alkalilimnicola ehrlichii TaxID=351052 RepID=UPI0006742450|nr:hypothetical protein [Alkalilimnicola ehrlichii]